MTISYIKEEYKNRMANQLALLGKRKLGYAVWVTVMLPVATLVILAAVYTETYILWRILFIVVIIDLIIMIFWRVKINKMFLKRFGKTHNLKPTIFFVSKDEMERVKKYELKLLFGKEIYNEKYIIKFKTLLMEEIQTTKKELNILNLPFFNVATSIIITIITAYFITPNLKLENVNPLQTIQSLGIAYISFAVVFLMYKFGLEDLMNIKHNRLKDLHRLVGHLEMESSIINKQNH